MWDDPAVALAETLAGPLEVEERLLDIVSAGQGSEGVDLDRLSRPVQLVFPSETARTWWVARLAERAGGLAGVEATTLSTVLARIDPAGASEITGARFEAETVATAAEDPRLAPLLGSDPARVLAPVRALLAAGLEPVHRDALREMLGRTSADVRAGALLDLAVRVLGRLAALGQRTRDDRCRRALAILARGESRLGPTRGTWLTGFGDTDAATADLLLTFARVHGATVLLEGTEGRLAERFGVSGVRPEDRRSPPAPILLREASDPDTEARAVAHDVATALDAGVPAERIGFCATSPGRTGPALARALRAHGLEALLVPEERTDPLTVELSRLLEEPSLDRLLPVAGLAPGRTARLRRRLAAQGASPGRPGDGDDDLDAELERLEALRADLSAWRDGPATTATRHGEELRRIFGSSPPDALAPLLESVDSSHGSDGDAGPDLAPNVFLSLLRRSRGPELAIRSLEAAARRTWDRLFVLGADRRSLPRTEIADPLLAESVRLRWSELLPDLQAETVGRRSRERALLARLFAASASTTVSWCRADERGESGPSPLLEAWRTGPSEVVPDLLGPERPLPLTREEELAWIGVHRGARVWSRALEDLEREDEPRGAARRAAHRLAFLDRVDPAPGSPHWTRPGSSLGVVGPAVDARDPRRGDLWITTLESLAVCPWQTWLQRALRLRPAPVDGGLEVPRSTLGELVHRVLEEIARDRPRDPAAGLAARLRRHASTLFAAPMDGPAAELAAPLVETALRVDWAKGAPATVAVEARDDVRGDLPLSGRRLRYVVDRIDHPDDGSRTRTDYKIGRPGDPDADLRTGRRLQTAAYLHDRREGGRARYLHLAPDVDDSERVVEVREGDPAREEEFRRAVARAVRVLDAGLFPPRLVDLRTDTEPPACRRCDVAAACRRPDSGDRRRLVRWASGGPDLDDLEDLAGADALRDLWLARDGS